MEEKYKDPISMVNKLAAGERKYNSNFVPSKEWIKEKISSVNQLTIEQDKLTAQEEEHLLNHLLQITVTTREPHAIVSDSDSKTDPEWIKNWCEKNKWYSWQAFRDTELQEEMSYEQIEELDRFGNDCLKYTGNPIAQKPFLKKGLVVGDIQSGKTTGYCTLITKAADLGYRNFIIFSGMSEDLRIQTQERIERSFIGCNTRHFPAPKYTDTPEEQLQAKMQFVRDSDANQIRPRLEELSEEQTTTVEPLNTNLLTSAQPKQDFNRKNISFIRPSYYTEPRPTLLVVKKNANILKNVIEWIEKYQEVTQDKDGDFSSKIRKSPTLIIDDEADLASINTALEYDTALGYGDEDGKKYPELSPSKINSQIREIIHSFDQTSYIGFTATPFANIFQNPKDLEKHKKTKTPTDLFPRDFIVDLNPPSNYFGTKRLFSIDTNLSTGQANEGKLKDQLPVIEILDNKDWDTWLPLRHVKDDTPGNLPKSLLRAIKVFIISTAIKEFRGIENHSTMMINCSRFIQIHQKIVAQIEEEIQTLSSEIKFKDRERISELKKIFHEDHLEKNSIFCQKKFKNYKQIYEKFPKWEEVLELLPGVVERLKNDPYDKKSSRNGVIALNSQSDSILDFTDTRFEKKGKYLYKIIVGGHRLSRGLTIQGLTVSYFTRLAKIPLYDSYIQMGRWFGYRDDYLDLIRLYIPTENRELLRRIGEATEEVRHQIKNLAENPNRTPENFAIYVEKHPVAKVTSPAKARHTKHVMINFNEGTHQCQRYSLKTSDLINNTNQLNKLLKKIQFNSNIINKNKTPRFIWDKVPKEFILDFLNGLKDIQPQDQGKINPKDLHEFLNKQHEDVMKNWTVVFSDRSILKNNSNEWYCESLNQKIGLRKRDGDPRNNKSFINYSQVDEDHDRNLDFTENEMKQLEQKRKKIKGIENQKTATLISQIRPKDRGLLVIYPIKNHYSDIPIIGWSMGIPANGVSEVSAQVNQTVYEWNIQLELL